MERGRTGKTMMSINRRDAIRLGICAAGAYAVGGTTVSAQDNPMPKELREALEREPNAPVLGKGNGDITLTEFFDYNCPFCRASVDDVHRLISEDKNLRVVFREWPVFGEGSVFSTKASLAALKQKKYWQFHTALMAIKGEANETTAIKVAQQVDLDLHRLREDMESPEVLGHIEHSMALANHMGLMGTPTFIAGNEALFGKQSHSDLRGLVQRGRAALL